MPSYLYFRAPSAAAVQKKLADAAGDFDSSVSDGIALKQVDHAVVLGQFLAFATGQKWSTSPAGDRLIWPDDPEDPDGPWVVELDDSVRDTLAAVPADRLPELATRWATIEEFRGTADPARLREVAEALIALAGRARAAGEPLFCHLSL